MMRSGSSRAIALALLLAVWVASTLGLVHATLHVPGDPGWTTTAAAERPTAVAKAPALRHGWTRSLFGDHTDGDCRLYDQLSHGASVPGVPLVVLPMLLPAATFAFLQGDVVARWVALFDARGPPSSR